jgi:predicted dithiol-disulfide oxidoreductase (DUF899 family)
MTAHEVVSRKEWLIARKALLAKERELTHLRDHISAERRALPWVTVEEDYVFDAPEGRVALADLFDGRSQLAVYHFMLAPGSDHICDGCAFVSDHVDAARQHFEQADLSFSAVSRAPLAQIAAVKRRMGWRFRWVSSFGSDFNYDYGVSFTDEQVAKGQTGYNYGTTPLRRRGPAWDQRVRQGRSRPGLPHLLGLRARCRIARRRLQLARFDPHGPQRGRHHELGAPARRIRQTLRGRRLLPRRLNIVK